MPLSKISIGPPLQPPHLRKLFFDDSMLNLAAHCGTLHGFLDGLVMCSLEEGEHDPLDLIIKTIKGDIAEIGRLMRHALVAKPPVSRQQCEVVDALMERAMRALCHYETAERSR